MEHEITFQEVTEGGSSDVKPIEINVVRATRAPRRIRTRLARSLARSRRARGTPADRSNTCMSLRAQRNKIVPRDFY